MLDTKQIIDAIIDQEYMHKTHLKNSKESCDFFEKGWNEERAKIHWVELLFGLVAGVCVAMLITMFIYISRM